MNERRELAFSRISEICTESIVSEPYGEYFRKVAGFIYNVPEVIKQMSDCKSQETLAALNRQLYIDILPENYAESYGNPEYAAKLFGKEMGRLLSFLYSQIREMIPLIFEEAYDAEYMTDVVIIAELFLEIYSAFVTAAQDKEVPSTEAIGQTLYYFISDYAELTVRQRTRQQLDASLDFAVNIIMNSDLGDVSYLYKFGEYITSNEIETAKYLNSLTQEQIQSMADTFTEGYRIGFVTTGKDISKKSTVNIRYNLGFERVVRQAILNFEKLGLKPIVYRYALHKATIPAAGKIGYMGAIANRQYDYDHKEDNALFLDKAFKDRKLELLRESYEEFKELAKVHAGPAVMEVFGEVPFTPVHKDAAYKLSEKQQKLSVDYASVAGRMVNEYIPGEERSFTIIAYPIPEIGDNFKEIFDETVKLNTLDYKTYQRIQQKLIDALDEGVAVHIKGKGMNRTDLRVKLRELLDREKETQFENCVADVNIPVGEVFTSPVLEGTSGVLHVSQVYLNGLKYNDLSVIVEDGFVKDYSLNNSGDEAADKKYFKKNVLYNHETLPMGEFAIGTNTTAYAMAKKYDVFDRLPILIAEKTGPHFAFGDTCYSHAEDVKVYNPDGKEIVSRDNSCSIKRKTEPDKAYFNCHTDITIPYDELDSIIVYRADGSSNAIISDGKFVLEGTQELNLSLEGE